MLESLDHVILAVRDLEAATRQYALLLGRSVSWRGKHPGQGTANALFRVDNTYLELLTQEGDGAVGGAVRAFLEARGEAPLGLAFGTRDAEACRAWLAERGLTPAPLEQGIGRDFESGAFREWRRVPIPLSETRGVLLFAIEHTTPDGILPTAGLACDETAAVSALDHAVVRTPDPDAAEALYGERLGLRLALDRAFPEWGMRLLFFRVGGVTLEIAAQDPRPEAGSPATARVEDDNDRLWGLSWRVPNADAARERLAGAGFDVSDVRAGRKPDTRVLTVRDGTCGVPTLLIEPPSR
jgi:catechol 2,3-dioxygenase-like lactoylglutathione lyase family enzyme